MVTPLSLRASRISGPFIYGTNTISIPDARVAAQQAANPNTWCSGRTAHIVSCGPAFIRGMAYCDTEVKFFCVSTTPFAFPVVPDVKIMDIGSSEEKLFENALCSALPFLMYWSKCGSFSFDCISSVTIRSRKSCFFFRLRKRFRYVNEQNTIFALVTVSIDSISDGGILGSTGTVHAPVKNIP